MPKKSRTCTVCGAVFIRAVTFNEEAKGWGRFCSKSCSTSFGKFLHGHYAKNKPSATYTTWQSMRQRCHDESSDGFQHYGAKGITVCEEWRYSFENFLSDMGERPKGLTLDRIDPSGMYCKENCRWATAKEQASNRKNNIILEIDGVSMTMAEACRKFGLQKGTVSARIKKGWPKHLWLIKNDSRKAPSRLIDV
jgi:hypothetical protein